MIAPGHRAALGYVLASAAIAWAALSGGCSVLIAPEDFPLVCEPDPAFVDPCPFGFHCSTERLCVEDVVIPPPQDGCVAAPTETCNGEDDNCNGSVDEGIDADGDGFTFCGTQRDTDGTLMAGAPSPTFQDCADDDPNTYPGAPEVCDGIDNDCVTSTPRDPNEIVCPAGLVCSDRTRSCVAPDDCTVFGCTGTTVCDPGTRMCVPEACPVCNTDQRCDFVTSMCVPLRSDGEGCDADAECMSHACFDLAQLGADRSNPTRGVCSRACCTENTCTGPGDVCFEARSGARACLPPGGAAAFGLGPRASAICSELNTMCTWASQPRGWCEDGANICYFNGAITCLNGGVGAADCGGRCERGGVCGGSDTRCGFVLSNNTVSGVCLTSSRTYVEAGGGCTVSADCRDGVCIAGTCAAPCCTDAECDSGRCLPSPGSFALMRCQAGTPVL